MARRQADLTVTSLAKALPYSQTQQERVVVFAACRNPDAASKLRCLPIAPAFRVIEGP
jgi:hypothetical protein